MTSDFADRFLLHAGIEIHNKSTVMAWTVNYFHNRTVSNYNCALPAPLTLGTIRVAPEIFVTHQLQYLFCKLFTQYFGNNGTIFFTVR